MLTWFIQEKVLAKAWLITVTVFAVGEFAILASETAHRPILNLDFALAAAFSLVLLTSIRYIRGNKVRSKKRPNEVSELGVWGYIWRQIVAALACVLPSLLFPKGNPILFQLLFILVSPIVVCLLFLPNRLLFAKNLLNYLVGVPIGAPEKGNTLPAALASDSRDVFMPTASTSLGQTAPRTEVAPAAAADTDHQPTEELKKALAWSKERRAIERVETPLPATTSPGMTSVPVPTEEPPGISKALYVLANLAFIFSYLIFKGSKSSVDDIGGLITVLIGAVLLLGAIFTQGSRSAGPLVAMIVIDALLYLFVKLT